MKLSEKFPLRLFLIIFAVFVVYIYLSFTTSPTALSEQLGFGSNVIRFFISISFGLPLFFAIFLGFWAGNLLFEAKGFDKNEKKGLRLFAIGILTAVSIIFFNIIIGQIRSRFFVSMDSYQIQKISTIIMNYLYSFGYLISFFIVFRGTEKLLPPNENARKWNMVASTVMVLLIGSLYGILIFSNPDRLVSVTLGAMPSHYLSDPMIFFTIVLPTVIAWFFAATAAFNLSDIFTVSENPIYQKAYRRLYNGILLIIFSEIVLQAILSIGTTRFLMIGLVPILLLLYLFTFALIAGNFFIVHGARELTRTS